MVNNSIRIEYTKYVNCRFLLVAGPSSEITVHAKKLCQFPKLCNLLVKNQKTCIILEGELLLFLKKLPSKEKLSNFSRKIGPRVGEMTQRKGNHET